VLYEPFGGTAGWTWGNGTYAVRTYDANGKIIQVDSGGLRTYAYDDAFRITGITDTITPANSWTYGYHALDRLTSAVKPSVTQGWGTDKLTASDEQKFCAILTPQLLRSNFQMRGRDGTCRTPPTPAGVAG